MSKLGLAIAPLTIRRFVLHRQADSTGLSGVGYVAEGVQFSDGTCVLRWLTSTRSTAVYASAADVERIHGHGGGTVIVYLDDRGLDLREPPPPPVPPPPSSDFGFPEIERRSIPAPVGLGIAGVVVCVVGLLQLWWPW